MKLNQAQIKILTDATAAGLEALVNAELQQKSERQLVSIQFSEIAGNFTCYIVYTL